MKYKVKMTFEWEEEFTREDSYEAVDYVAPWPKSKAWPELLKEKLIRESVSPGCCDTEPKVTVRKI